MLGAYRQKMNVQLKNVPSLGLGSVLVGSLPATLLTDDAPDRYTVEAVLTRQADRDEVAAIQGSAMRDELTAAGYPTVELHVSDRRLEISNTNLEELRDGLAAVLVDQLASISLALRADRDAAALRFSEASERETQRAAAVAALADSVNFASPATR
jgi:YbbR domain-containing protein